MLILLVAGDAAAVVLAPVSAISNASASISFASEPFSNSLQSTDLEPSLVIEDSAAGGFISVRSVLSVSIQETLAVPTINVSSTGDARTNGAANASVVAYDYALEFTIDVRSSVRLENANSGASTFPIANAPTASDDASLIYSIREAGSGGATLLQYAAPASNVAGLYATATLPAGTYVLGVVGSASAVDGEPSVRTSSAGGNVRFSFEDAPLVVPGLGSFGAALALAGAMIVGAARRSR